MTRYERPEPVEVVDRLLWRDAQQMLQRHSKQGPEGQCQWCGWQWPCPARRLAERAEAASRQPWQVSETVRHDLNTVGVSPGQNPRAAYRANSGLFDNP